MIDWTDAFDNSGYVPGSDRLGDELTAAASAYRAGIAAVGLADLDIDYGPNFGPDNCPDNRHDARNRFDLFRPEGAAKGLVVFVHGGYWQWLDRSFWSHMAEGARAAGWAVAIPSYRLAPGARIADITVDVANAVAAAAGRVAGPVRLIGHSAGGHLVSRMAVADGPLAPDIAARLQKVVSVSGIHDLRPLLLSEMNATLRLDEAEAAAESPALATPRAGLPVCFWVGTRERPELLRQTRLIGEAWIAQSDQITEQYDPGHNHFSVIDALAVPGSALVTELLQ